MKKLKLILIALALTGCASTNSIGHIRPEAVPKVGKITSKETIISRTIDRRHTMGYWGRPHHGMWRYEPFFDWPDYSTTVREDVSYQYKISFNNTEKLILQSEYNLDVGQCVTIWYVPNSKKYPRVDRNLDCKLPEIK